MKPTAPILKADYVPSWKQHPNHLARRFAQIRREQRKQDRREAEDSLNKILRLKRA